MPEELLSFLATGTAAAVLAAIINAVVNRRKLSAEATQIITQASAGVVENIMKDNSGLREEIARKDAIFTKEIDALRREVSILREAQARADQRERAHAISEERWRHHLERWHRYSARQAEEIRALGGSLEEQPPYWPEPVMSADLED